MSATNTIKRSQETTDDSSEVPVSKFTNYLEELSKTDYRRLDEKIDALKVQMDRIETLIIRASKYQLPPFIERNNTTEGNKK